VVSSSRNAPPVLEAAGIAERFAVVVDGNVSAREHLPGKPAPDTFAYAAAQLGVPKERAVVFEDALSGVAAGRAGNFGLVVGVDRGVGADRLLESGADVVVADLAELVE
jgi:HAD superfamily hydrolase (TIGR01509 family)